MLCGSKSGVLTKRLVDPGAILGRTGHLRLGPGNIVQLINLPGYLQHDRQRLIYEKRSSKDYWATTYMHIVAGNTLAVHRDTAECRRLCGLTRDKPAELRYIRRGVRKVYGTSKRSIKMRYKNRYCLEGALHVYSQHL